MVMVLQFLLAVQLLVRPYHPVTVDQLASGSVKATHVQVTGRVRLIRHERDGDWHLKLSGLKAFIVAECIPEIECIHGKIKVGDLVTVRGIDRKDMEHGWWEVHPVESLEVVR